MIENGQPDGGYLLKHGGCEIPFRLSLGDRKKLTIHVHPEMRVEVLAPQDRDVESILARIQGRARWIVKQWRYFEQFQPKQPDRRFVSGETHVYLGRQYRLKIVKGAPADVKLLGRYFVIRCSDPDDSDSVSRLLQDWYLQHAKALFTARLNHWISECRPLGVHQIPKLIVRRMARRWGSCTRRGTITLNVDLIKVPRSFIDYVIVHELCHLRVHSHGPGFYKLLSRAMPDWRQRKKGLEAFVTCD